MAQVVEEAESIENGRLSRSASFPVISIHANDENPADLREKSKSTLFTGSTREAFFELKKAKRNKLLKKTNNFLRKISKNVFLNEGSVTIRSMPSSKDLPDLLQQELQSTVDSGYVSEDEVENYEQIPPLNICMLIVGTRGDVQPFIAIGKKLKERGHRVRLASHANFRDFVMDEGLEFYPLGGDPKVLAEYMVKNKGFLPSRPSEVTKQRNQLKSILYSTWPACIEPDSTSNGQPFTADAIIANPPAMGHTHVAEALKVPLHIFFTMPWTPTAKWPHPLATIPKVAHTGFENKLSYFIVETTIWLGVADMINGFRRTVLKLKPEVDFTFHHFYQKDIPTGYIWSPSLAPKPDDWGKKIDVVGFCFLRLASKYTPPPELVEFLKSGTPPVFFGLGSLPVQEPKKMTEIVVEALRLTGQRGIIQKGWGGLGELDEPAPHVYLLGNCPHDWLFPQCAAVIHHGGAGTTAAGLKAECPTTIVPFFGDQPFWGNCVYSEGVGPKPISVEHFNLESVKAAIEFMLKPSVKEAAKEMADKINGEDGAEDAVVAFLRNLPPGIKTGAHSLPWMKEVKMHHWLKHFCSCGSTSLVVD